MALQWTTTAPTTPGWYFVRTPDPLRMEIRKYDEAAIDALQYAVFSPPQEWAGPLPCNLRTAIADCNETVISEEEADRTRETVKRQTKELVHILFDNAVTCGSCGRKVVLARSCRCYYCGVYFCDFCAAQHFGGARPKAYKPC